jgi:hypothetical protein
MIWYLILKKNAILSKSLFSFFLDKKRNKKIKAANKKAEIFNISLKSRNSPEDYNNLKLMPAQTALIS